MNRDLVSRNQVMIALLVSFLFLAMRCIGDAATIGGAGRTTVVFCDVGQGDASYVRLAGGFDILIDAGPDRAVLRCLGEYMPIWDRTIELAILSHPDADHYAGYAHVLRRYRIGTFLLPRVGNESGSFSEILYLLRESNAGVAYPVAGDRISVPHGTILVAWPTNSYIEEYGRDRQGIPSEPITDRNAFSLVFLLQLRNRGILYTGDTSPDVLRRIVLPDTEVDVLKIPHHGSGNGLTHEFLRRVDPLASVVSAGRDNRFGHPHQRVVDLFSGEYGPLYGTQLLGDIVFRIDTRTGEISLDQGVRRYDSVPQRH
jgi:competence protein ComEC